MTRRYVPVAETAKYIRAALKEAFPKIKFSVRSHSYSGGASIRVDWTDGPTEAMVRSVTGQFSGATFDAMTDYKDYHDSEFNGETVHWGADYVFTEREYSEAFLQHVLDFFALQRYSWDGAEPNFKIKTSKWREGKKEHVRCWIEANPYSYYGNPSAQEVINKICSQIDGDRLPELVTLESFQWYRIYEG
jgi:hypothetical protein